MAEAAPFGSWKSPISSETLVKDKIRFGTMHVHEDALYWIEGRPSEKGRQALVKWKNGSTKDLIPSPYNVRTRVHEYGGNCFIVCGEAIYFSNFKDNKLYKQASDGSISAVTQSEKMRFADPTWNTKTGQLFLVCEDHTLSDLTPENCLVSFRMEDKSLQKVVTGHDFYMAPTVSPDGKKIAWICWNHPNMPWDGTELWVADLDEKGHLSIPKFIAGGLSESISEPKWSSENELYFLSDRSGWWNIYHLSREGNIEAVFPMEAEFGVPAWVFGSTRYGFIPDKSQIVCIYTQKGIDQLGIIEIGSKTMKPVKTPFTCMKNLVVLGDHVIFDASSPEQLSSIVVGDLKSNSFTPIKKSGDLGVSLDYISIPELIEFPTEGGKTAYAFYYPPKNPDYKTEEGQLPPLLVLSHGGPTAHNSSALDLKKQFWTSRGFAFVDVNYGGSTGFGRNYRERLKRNWGIVDVDDCVNAALYLVKKRLADPEKLAIAGGSAGGYTTLAALTFRNIFKAGASYYGVSDLEALLTDTHKFESHYMEQLVGPYPEKKKIYQERSPLQHLDRLSCPVIFLQGDEDKIVPPNQSEKMYAALKKKGIPTAYILFKGEQHGFRGADAIKQAIEAEYYFYSKTFNFPLSEKISPIAIEGK